MRDAQIVARAKQTVALDSDDALPRPVHQVIRQAARLRAVTAHRRAATSQSREPTRTRISDADGAVAEHLDGHARGTKHLDLCHAQFARGRHALDSQLFGRQSHRALAVDARLSRQVNLDPRNRRAKRACQPGVGHDQRVGAQLQRVCPQRNRVCQLVIEHKYVERHVYAHAMGMGHGAPAREFVIAKAMRAHSGVESVQPRIDGIGARRNRREHLVESAGRRQQLG